MSLAPFPTPAKPLKKRLQREQAGPGRVHGLDGLRALAVVLVLIFHIDPNWAPGGFVGVDLFFVVSGYLITTLLLREHRDHGRIDLRRFYLRRARRLLPAVVVVVAVCTAAAAAIGGDVLVGLGWSVLGIFTFMANWVQMWTGFDYFNAQQAGLFDNFWSLAIEEQFYFVWPLLLILLLARGALFPRSAVRRARGGLIAAALLSAVLMYALVQTGQANIAYLATVSHLYGILLGAALAMSPRLMERGEPSTTPALFSTVLRAFLAAVLGATGLAGLLLITFSPLAERPGSEPMLTLAGSLAALMLLGACLLGGADGMMRLDRGLLGWMGTRSYGLYLWHFPLIVLADQLLGMGVFPMLEQTQLRVLAVGLGLLAAELSYRYVELPVRRHGFSSLVQLPSRALASGLMIAVLVSSVVWAQNRAPQQTQLQQVLADAEAETEAFGTPDDGGAEHGDAEQEPRGEAAEDYPAEAAEQEDSSQDAGQDSGQNAEQDGSEQDGGAEQDGTGTEVGQLVAVGDSVMLASAPALQDRFDIRIDAAQSRQLHDGPALVSQAVAEEPAADAVLLGLGTNGVGGESDVREAVDNAGDRTVVLVTLHVPQPYEASHNEMLHEVASDHENVVVADWHGAISGSEHLLASDQTHPNAEGGELYADAVEAALQ